jgi:glucan biosynthesis protein C
VDHERIHYIDWLKVLIVYGIFFFHVALVFAAGTWLVSNQQRSVVLSALAGFCFPWGIPAMFMIAGADAWFGLRSHSMREFIWGRVQRLLIPMAVGLVTLSPLQRFVTSSNPPPPIDQLWPFYVNFFRGFRFQLTLEWIATNWLHLWFLGYLFAISVACLPLLVWLRKPGGRRLSSLLVAIANRRGGLYLVAAPLLISQLVLRPLFPTYQSWADVATYTLVFIWGAIMFSNRDFEAAIRRDIHWILLTGVVAIAGVAILLYVLPASQSGGPLTQAAFSFLWAIDIWSWLLAVLYLGIRWLDVPNRALTYLQESVLPFYVIHHPVVLAIASFVVTWDLGVWPKFVVIVVAGLSLTVGLYEFGVRRWAPMRWLFGLKPLAAAGRKEMRTARAAG